MKRASSSSSIERVRENLDLKNPTQKIARNFVVQPKSRTMHAREQA